MSDHQELVSEMGAVERMTTQDRLKHARKRRSQQLKKWGQYEKQLDKESSKKRKQSSSQNNASRVRRRKNLKVKFDNSVALLEASARNDLEEVRRVLQNNTSPDVTNEDGLTALHQCCIDDSESMLNLLLEFGANVNAQDTELWTPLHAAATCGHVHLCRRLIDSGAELLAVNADGNMPYDICEDEITLDYIETEMSKRGITQEQIDETRLATEKKMLDDLKTIANDRRALERRDNAGVSPLHIAAANGYLEVADFLLNKGVAVNLRDDDSWQAIHAAAYWGQPEILELLVQYGAHLDAKTRSGETAFDLCEDPDLKQKILDMKDELETTKASKGRDLSKRHRISTRGLAHSPGWLYSSNSSLSEKNPHSASIRRSSLRGEKSPLAKKEAKEEALHFGLRTMQDDDDLAEAEDENKENLPATNIDDVTIILPSDDKVDNELSLPAEMTKPDPVVKTSQRVPKHAESDDESKQPLQGKVPSNFHPETRNTDSLKTQNAQSKEGSSVTAHLAVDEPVRKSSIESNVSANQGLPGGRSGQSQPPSQPPPPSQPRYPSGVPSGVTLADLKKQRAEMRRTDVDPQVQRRDNIDAHVQSMFLESLKHNNVPPPAPPKNKAQNGHNNNNNRQLRRYTAPHHTVVIGGEDEKTTCCVIM